jgi:heme/copper-type cytochrome/quinol oxidase subunit 2
MTQVLQRDGLRIVLMALVLIGIVLVLIGIFLFVDAALRLQNNPAYQASLGGEPLALGSDAQAQGLIAAGMEYRRLLAQRNNALIIGGAGLVAGAFGWLGYDFVRGRRRRSQQSSAH